MIRSLEYWAQRIKALEQSQRAILAEDPRYQELERIIRERANTLVTDEELYALDSLCQELFG